MNTFQKIKAKLKLKRFNIKRLHGLNDYKLIKYIQECDNLGKDLLGLAIKHNKSNEVIMKLIDKGGGEIVMEDHVLELATKYYKSMEVIMKVVDVGSCELVI